MEIVRGVSAWNSQNFNVVWMMPGPEQGIEVIEKVDDCQAEILTSHERD